MRGDRDGFIIAIDSSGEIELVTYLGGSGADSIEAVAVTPEKDVLIAGSTTSEDFPVQASFQGVLLGSESAFGSRLAGGRELLWSTFVGGSTIDGAQGVAFTGGGIVLASGTTNSSDFPVLYPTYVHQGGTDAWVTALAADGSEILFSTHHGDPAGSLFGARVTVDPSGRKCAGIGDEHRGRRGHGADDGERAVRELKVAVSKDRRAADIHHRARNYVGDVETGAVGFPESNEDAAVCAVRGTRVLLGEEAANGRSSTRYVVDGAHSYQALKLVGFAVGGKSAGPGAHIVGAGAFEEISAAQVVVSVVSSIFARTRAEETALAIKAFDDATVLQVGEVFVR